MPMRLAALPISGFFSRTDAKSSKISGPNSTYPVKRRLKLRRGRDRGPNEAVVRATVNANEASVRSTASEDKNLAKPVITDWRGRGRGQVHGRDGRGRANSHCRDQYCESSRTRTSRSELRSLQKRTRVALSTTSAAIRTFL